MANYYGQYPEIYSTDDARYTFFYDNGERVTLIAGENGATEVHVSAAHGVFCGPAKERLEVAPIDSIVVTDTIPKNSMTLRGVVIRSVGDLLGDAILRIHQGRSVSKLFPQT